MTSSTANAATTPARPNRMERRRLETRNKLLEATLQLVVEKGIEKTTLDDITEAADLGRRTFYYHFQGKDECIQAAAAAVYQRHAQRVDEEQSMDDICQLVALSVQDILGKLLEEPVTRCLVGRPRLLGEAIMTALGGFIRRDITVGMAEGTFDPPVDPDMLDRLILWTVVGVVIESLDTERAREVSLRDYAQTFLMILGVPADEARTAADAARDAIAD